METKYYEVDFVNGYGMVIKANREPTLEELDEFIAEDANKNDGILSMYGPYRKQDVEPFYDFSNEEQWPMLIS